MLSAPRDNVATLTLDPLLIQDLTFLFASAAVSISKAFAEELVNWSAANLSFFEYNSSATALDCRSRSSNA